MLADLLPAAVCVAEVFADPPDARLFPAEEPFVARAVAGRRQEFVTGRHCARAALAGLGVAPVAIVRGERGAPQWPGGVVGSITHCTGYRAAAVARADQVTTLGIDAEPAQPLPAGVLRLVSLPGEREMLAELAADRPEVPWDRLLFSAKESVYKAWAPLTGTWLDFSDAELTIGTTGTFLAKLLIDGARLVGGERGELTGRYLVRDGLVVTAVAR
ncbi:MAG TPA: 4'-phosphopantetheinyl transferase superfamily protein [Actinoplanes sp.]